MRDVTEPGLVMSLPKQPTTVSTPAAIAIAPVDFSLLRESTQRLRNM
jgi:hypothetical protein